MSLHQEIRAIQSRFLDSWELASAKANDANDMYTQARHIPVVRHKKKEKEDDLDASVLVFKQSDGKEEEEEVHVFDESDIVEGDEQYPVENRRNVHIHRSGSVTLTFPQTNPFENEAFTGPQQSDAVHQLDFARDIIRIDTPQNESGINPKQNLSNIYHSPIVSAQQAPSESPFITQLYDQNKEFEMRKSAIKTMMRVETSATFNKMANEMSELKTIVMELEGELADARATQKEIVDLCSQYLKGGGMLDSSLYSWSSSTRLALEAFASLASEHVKLQNKFRKQKVQSQKQHRSKNSESPSRVSKLKNTLIKKERRIVKLQDHVENSNEELNKLRERVKALESTNKKFTNSRSNTEDVLRKRIKALQSTNKKLTNASSEVEDELGLQLEKLRFENTQLQRALASLKSAKHQVESSSEIEIRKERGILEQENTTLKETVTRISTDLETKCQEIASLTEERNQLHNDWRELLKATGGASRQGSPPRDRGNTYAVYEESNHNTFDELLNIESSDDSKRQRSFSHRSIGSDQSIRSIPSLESIAESDDIDHLSLSSPPIPISEVEAFQENPFHSDRSPTRSPRINKIKFDKHSEMISRAEDRIRSISNPTPSSSDPNNKPTRPPPTVPQTNSQHIDIVKKESVEKTDVKISAEDQISVEDTEDTIPMDDNFVGDSDSDIEDMLEDEDLEEPSIE